MAEEGKRDWKRKQLTEHVVKKREQKFSRNGIPPSPHSHHPHVWKEYIKLRLEMMEDEFSVYATRKYARIDFDHYLCSNRATDKLAVKVTNNEPSVIYMGTGFSGSNRPFGIKGRQRAPGPKKFVMSVKKLGHSVVKPTDEWMTSQTCANCYKRFPLNTKKHRFKVCRDCNPPPDAILPLKIYTTLSRRELQRKRKELDERGEYDHRFLADEPLVTKWKTYYKQWPRPPEIKKIQTVVWHRDIVAAKNILTKGEHEVMFIFNVLFSIQFDLIGRCKLLGLEIPAILRRPPPRNVPNYRPELRPILRARPNRRNAPNEPN